LIILTEWFIWKHQNGCAFEGQMPDEQQLAMWDEATLWANVQARVFPWVLSVFSVFFCVSARRPVLFLVSLLFSSLFLVFP